MGSDSLEATEPIRCEMCPELRLDLLDMASAWPDTSYPTKSGLKARQRGLCNGWSYDKEESSRFEVVRLVHVGVCPIKARYSAAEMRSSFLFSGNRDRTIDATRTLHCGRKVLGFLEP